jgi:hypothetical protein
MKTDSLILANRQTGLVLKVTGIILILGVLVDYAILAIPPDFSNSSWLVNLMDQWIGRGTVPLLGMAFLIFGIWVDRATNGDRDRNGLLLSTLALSLLLGIVFLVFVPLHLINSNLAGSAQTEQINQQINQINQQAQAAQQQLEGQLTQQKAKVSALLADDQQVAQLQQQLDNAPPEQQAQLKQIRETLDKVKANPKALDQEVEKARTQGMAQIQQQQQQALSVQQQALKQAQTVVRKSRNQATIDSILLSFGYFVVGAAGLFGLRSRDDRSVTARSRR